MNRRRKAVGDVVTLDTRALNRALLERQLLSRRHAMPALRAVEHLVGLQAQAPNPPYYGLWSRLESFEPDELGELISVRRVVRLALMRSTIHAVSAGDALALRPLLQPAIDRMLASGYGRMLDGVDRDAMVAAARALLSEAPRTASELAEALADRWPALTRNTIANAVRAWLPLVQLPPRGVWGRSGGAAHAPLDAWLAIDGSAPATSIEMLVKRYLAAFGPASVQDVQTWSGLSRLREVLEPMRPQLRAFRDERGAELFDVPDAPLPDRDTPQPARCLAEFDNVLLSHADRTRIISEPYRRRIATSNGMVPGTVLLDGFVRGTWRIVRDRRSADLVIEMFDRWSKRERLEAAEEGAQLLAFGAAGFDAGDVRFIAG